MAQIGFIGLGHMGLPMALNLVKAGHCVTGFDLQDAPMAALAVAGGVSGKSAQQAAVKQDVVITMLQTGLQVQQLMLGETGLLSLMNRASLYMDCSTIDVDSARRLHQSAESLGIFAVDAPVSGGVVGAHAGRLTVMIGGTEAAFLKASPFLQAMGKTLIHAGDAGSGQAAKICNNMILGSSMIAVSEAFVLAAELGLTPQKLQEVVAHASGQCWVMDTYVPVPDVLPNVPANHDYEPGFAVAMMLKDLDLSQQAAKKAGLSLPMAERATLLYKQFNDNGNDTLDFSAIIQSL